MRRPRAALAPCIALATTLVVGVAPAHAEPLQRIARGVSHRIAVGIEHQRILVVERDASKRLLQPGEGGSIREPQWSPDGRWFLYAAHPPTRRMLAEPGALGEIRVMRTDGSADRAVVTLPSYVYAPRWSPDGRHISFITGHTVGVFPVAGATVAQLMVVRRDGTGLRVVATGQIYDQTWSRDGTRIAYREASGLFVVPVEGTNVPQAISPPGMDVSLPRWSPKGNTIAFIGAGPLSVEGALYVVAPDGTGLTRLASADTFSWSPDGRRIAYQAAGIHVVDVATGRHRKVTPIDAAPVWSPDGATIAFIEPSLNVDVILIRPDGRNLRVLTTAPGLITSAPAWSPR